MRRIHSESPSSSSPACSGPCRSSADVVIDHISAGEQILHHIAGVLHPVVAASEARIRPYSKEIQVRGNRASAGLDRLTLETSGDLLAVDVGLHEPVEEHQPVGARVIEQACHLPRRAEVRAQLHGMGTADRGLDRLEHIEVADAPPHDRRSADRPAGNRC